MGLPGPQLARRATLLTPLLAGIAACELPSLIRTNTETVRESTVGIAENTRTVQHSTEVTAAMLPAMEGLQGLSAPMQSVAELKPALASVAGLEEPMRGVAGLSPAMQSLTRLQTPMTRVALMRPSLDAVAALHGSLGLVAALKPELSAVAGLREPMRDVAQLRQPMERVAGLRDPMTRLANAAALVDNPIKLVLLAVIGLGAWAAVTFFAVRLAILSAMRVGSATGGGAGFSRR